MRSLRQRPVSTTALRKRNGWPQTLFVIFALSGALPVTAQVCPFDDVSTALTREGLILTRYALGMRGATLVANTDLVAADAATVEATITCPSCGLDINGNGGFDTVDATIISRKIAGLSGDALTNGLNLALAGPNAATRNTPAAVNSFLLAGCGATGGTVTSITAGTGLVTASGLPITSAGAISIQNSGVDSLQLAFEAVTGSKIAPLAVTNSKIAAGAVTTSKIADDSVTQAKVFASGTATDGKVLGTTGTTLQWQSLTCSNVTSALQSTPSGGVLECATATCPTGTLMHSGGINAVGWTTELARVNSSLNASKPSGNGWQVCYFHVGSGAGRVEWTTVARCCSFN